MKMLFAIPHYYNPDGKGNYGSTRNNPQPRIKALRNCIAAINQLFAKKQFMLDISTSSAVPVPELQENEVKIVVMTTQNKHLLAGLPLSTEFYTHLEVMH